MVWNRRGLGMRVSATTSDTKGGLDIGTIKKKNINNMTLLNAKTRNTFTMISK